MCLSKHEMVEKLTGIFLKRTGKDFRDKELWQKKLFGPHIKMSVEELIYVYFDIERTFGIQITENHLLDGNFDTFEHICNIIKDAVCMPAEEV